MLNSRSVIKSRQVSFLLFKPKITAMARRISYTVGDETDMKNLEFRRPLIIEIPQTDLFSKHAKYVQFISLNKNEECSFEEARGYIYFWAVIGLIWSLPTLGFSFIPFGVQMKRYLAIKNYVISRNISNEDFLMCVELEKQKLKK